MHPRGRKLPEFGISLRVSLTGVPTRITWLRNLVIRAQSPDFEVKIVFPDRLYCSPIKGSDHGIQRPHIPGEGGEAGFSVNARRGS